MVSSAMGPDAAATPLFPAEKPPLSGSPGRAAPSCPVPKGSLIPAGPEALPEPAAPPPPSGRSSQGELHLLPRAISDWQGRSGCPAPVATPGFLFNLEASEVGSERTRHGHLTSKGFLLLGQMGGGHGVACTSV